MTTRERGGGGFVFESSFSASQHLSVVFAELIDMHRFHNAVLIIHARVTNRHTPNGGAIAPAANDVGIEATFRMNQLDIPFTHTLGPPHAIAATGDPLLALTADVTVVIEAMVDGAATGSDTLVRGGKVEAVGVRTGGRFEGTEAEGAGDDRPEMGDVGDDDGGGGFAGVPVQVDEGAVASGEVVIAVEDGAEDDEGTEGEDAEEDDFSGETVRKDGLEGLDLDGGGGPFERQLCLDQ